MRRYPRANASPMLARGRVFEGDVMKRHTAARALAVGGGVFLGLLMLLFANVD